MRIGNVQLETNLLLAPIARYCDLAFRTICREQGGVGLACTDLLSPQGLLRGTQTSLELAHTNDFDTPICMQLYGSDPKIMAEGAKWAQDHGATIIDINMGCPVDKVTKKDGGSKLMCDIPRAMHIAEAVTRVISVPLTCKMRLGWTEEDKQRNVAGTLACQLIDGGAAAITVHGRTTEQKFSGEADLPGIKRVVDTVRAHVGDRVPVIGNGDITSPEAAQRMLRETTCDGIMIGRGALSKPWIFRDCWAHLQGNAVPAQPSDAAQIEMIRRFFDLMLRYRSERAAMNQIRQRISLMGKHIAGGHCKALKEAIRTAASPDDVHQALYGFLAGILTPMHQNDVSGSNAPVYPRASVG
ncbi:MAG: tRNA-dihydrouridine synthase [Phycisphaeraceae bacterium]|nr:tRNA-dihydrouridine synthase [Phycisphaerales bacterium]MCB9860981.1 tRNA-dihydrouridine synthase [Phycisphaeraceae bacterium]